MSNSWTDDKPYLAYHQSIVLGGGGGGGGVVFIDYHILDIHAEFHYLNRTVYKNVFSIHHVATNIAHAFNAQIDNDCHIENKIKYTI